MLGQKGSIRRLRVPAKAAPTAPAIDPKIPYGRRGFTDDQPLVRLDRTGAPDRTWTPHGGPGFRLRSEPCQPTWGCRQLVIDKNEAFANHIHNASMRSEASHRRWGIHTNICAVLQGGPLTAQDCPTSLPVM